MKPSCLPVFLRRALTLAALTTLGSSPVLAATWYWDANSGTTGAQQAAGTWSNGGSTWWDGTATVPWNNSAGNIAHFGTDTGAGILETADGSRTITIPGTVNAAGLVLNSNTLSSYILSGGEIALADGSTINVKGGDSTDTNTKRHRILSIISGANINIARTTTTTLAMLRLFGSNTWTGTLTLSSTAGEGIFVEALGGAALNNLNTVSVGVNSSMILAAAQTFTPGFSIAGTGAGGNRGAIRFDTNGASISGSVTLDASAIINTNSGVTATISGSINQVNSSRTLTLNPSGGNLVFSANNTFVGPVTLSSGSLVLNGNNSFSSTVAVGGNSLSLLGQNQFTGTGQITMNGGSLTLGSPSSVTANGSIAKPIVLTGSTNTIVAIVGPGGFTAEQFANLPSFGTSGTGSASYGLSAQTDLNWTSALFGNLPFTKSGPGTLTLLGSRTDSGPITIREGALRFSQIADGGQPSSIGTSSSAAANLVLSGGRLVYAGPEAYTDRLFTLTASSAIESSGTGPIIFDNPGTNTASTSPNSNARTLTLTGHNTGANEIKGVIANAGSGAVSVTKNGHGNWTLSGANTNTGTIRIDNGALTLDYATNDPIFGNAGTVGGSILTNGGKLTLKGGAVTSDRITTWTFTGSQSSGTWLKLDNMALTVDTLTGGANVQRNDLIDLSGNPANSLTIGALAGNFGPHSGILMGAGSAGAFRANIVLRDKDGTYGFPALSGGTSGTIQKLSTFTNLSIGAIVVNNNAVNYRFSEAGTHTATANLNFCTMTFDSTAGDITLDVNVFDMSPLGLGKAFLMSGPNDVFITGSSGNTDAGDDSAQWFHNYLDNGAKFDIEADFGQAQSTFFGGTGFTTYRGIGFTDNFILTGGVFRPTESQGLLQNQSDAPNFKVTNGGILEIGARLTDDELTFPLRDFTKPIDATVGGVRFLGDSGLSAYTETPGGTRVVNFSTKVPPDYFNTFDPVWNTQNLVWGSGYFLVTPETLNSDADAAFLLSSPYSNAMIEIQNVIDLNGKPRVVQVANGSAEIDARLSGQLTGGAAAGLVKKGPGTLQLTGINLYQGATHVMEGQLRIDGSSLDPASSLIIENGATLHVTGTVSVASVTVGGVVKAGTVTGPNITGGGTLISGATLPPYEQWVVDKTIPDAVAAPLDDADNDGIRNLIEYAVGSEPKTANGSVLTITGTAPRVVRFNHPAGRTDIAFVLESSPTLGTPWTVVATSTAGAAFTSSAANVTVSEVSNLVTVTDNRTPAAVKMFYRLRADK